mgnify:CR=1 FL=1
MANKVKSAAYLFLFTIFFSACVATPHQEVKLVYPLPPQEPRIAFLGSYRGEIDVKKKSAMEGFLGFLFGSAERPDLQKPYGVASFGDKIYVTDTGSGEVLVIDVKERKVHHIGDGGSGKLAVPIGIAIAADGTIFVADAKLKRVFGYDQTGKVKVAIGQKDELKNPAGLAINNELGRLYVVDSHGNAVHVYSTKGEPLFQLLGGEGGFLFPSNVAVDRRNGNVYVVDSQNFRVQVFDKDGKFLRTFGKIGDVPGTFSRPKGIGIDSEGHVYVVDAAFNNVQIFDEQGQLLLFIGAEGRAPGYFQLPAGMYVDEKDRIYVVDSFNFRVQVFQYLSDRWKKEHPEEYKKYILTEPAAK